jgi:hypothetical protein
MLLRAHSVLCSGFPRTQCTPSFAARLVRHHVVEEQRQHSGGGEYYSDVHMHLLRSCSCSLLHVSALLYGVPLTALRTPCASSC